MDTTALDAVPELYRRTIAAIEGLSAAVNGLAALVASRAPAAEITEAAAVAAHFSAQVDDFRASFERAAGEVIRDGADLFAKARRQSLREGAARRDTETAAEQGTAHPPPLALVAFR